MDTHPSAESPVDIAAVRDAPVPRRWTLHGLNNGLIFGATCQGVRTLPRRVSYGIGEAGTWIAWKTMAHSRAAIAHNLAAVFPGEADAALERRALETFRAYARDAIDFLRALAVDPRATATFDTRQEDRRAFEAARARGRGILLVTGHYGNWEAGSIFIRRQFDLPITIVAMAEASPEVNRIRREIRERLGADTIDVRQSIDTALQIRRHLAENRIVAMLVDRHYGRDRVPVTLFGRCAWFLRSPLLLAQAAGTPVLPCFIERTGPGRFDVRLDAPIELTCTQPREAELTLAAQRIADALAARIRRHPQYWYHFYRYWDAQRDAYDGLA